MTTAPVEPCTCPERHDRSATCARHGAFDAAEQINRDLRAINAIEEVVHVVTYGNRRRPHLSPLKQWHCTCGRTGSWTDADTAREQGQRHGRSA